MDYPFFTDEEEVVPPPPFKWVDEEGTASYEPELGWHYIVNEHLLLQLSLFNVLLQVPMTGSTRMAAALQLLTMSKASSVWYSRVLITLIVTVKYLSICKYFNICSTLNQVRC